MISEQVALMQVAAQLTHAYMAGRGPTGQNIQPDPNLAGAVDVAQVNETWEAFRSFYVALVSATDGTHAASWPVPNITGSSAAGGVIKDLIGQLGPILSGAGITTIPKNIADLVSAIENAVKQPQQPAASPATPISLSGTSTTVGGASIPTGTPAPATK